MALTPEMQALKDELLVMVQLKLPVDDPLVLDWLERAVNVLGKDQLDPNELWVYDSASDMLVKKKKH
ncbi:MULTISPECIES: hypothetical protein [Shewanella]|jgi:adenine specific DNA methylase Mod|uniref:hypothetical protein n=1 Tax=Shewanella TaxID=22 RepID=UPI001CC74D6E|nr:hypothetical protein [Shewanella xiamenensis]BDA62593.1 hypothetical protein NUITMVS1_40560 [Shewanella xiamenensis]